MPSDIKVRVDKAIAEKVFPGCVVGIVKKIGERTMLSFGRFTYDVNAPRVAEDTIYDLASVTKSIPTASLALTLIAEGKLRSTDVVVKYLSELKNDYGATIEDLLTHRVSGTRLSTLKNETPAQILKYVFARGFNGPPGGSSYTNFPALLLGLIVERIAGQPLDGLAQKYFFGPLGMTNTTFFPNVRPTRSNIAPTEIDERGEVQGLPHDESAYVFAREKRVVGHAGLFSTAPDMLNFLESLLQGKYPDVVDGAQRGLGWQLDQPWFMGANYGPHTFGKTGFTGTSIVVDIERGIAFVILSNRTYPKRPPDAASINSAINPFRADIADMLLC